MSDTIHAIDRIVAALDRLTKQIEIAEAFRKTEVEVAVASPPPPQIVVECKGKTVVVGRESIMMNDMRWIYIKFTRAFNLPEVAEDIIRGEWLRWSPMKIYVTFRYGPSSNGNYEEVPNWAATWVALLPNIDRIRVEPKEQEAAESQ